MADGHYNTIHFHVDCIRFVFTINFQTKPSKDDQPNSSWWTSRHDVLFILVSCHDPKRNKYSLNSNSYATFCH